MGNMIRLFNPRQRGGRTLSLTGAVDGESRGRNQPQFDINRTVAFRNLAGAVRRGEPRKEREVGLSLAGRWRT